MSAHSPARASAHGDSSKPLLGTVDTVLPMAESVDARFRLQRSPSFLRAVELCRIYAPVRRPVVFVGPVGVGKSTMARLVHQLSARTGRFVAVSAGEIPDSLVQSRLFGHMRGAFTGATERRPGAFEAAAGGTLLFDDVACLSTYVQSSLLRVLEDRAFTPLGAVRDLPVTCRELYATTQSLETLQESGAAVTDFLSRIGDLVVEIPPLRDRPEDILPLAEYYLKRVSEEFEWRPPALGTEVCELLIGYGWPHNVRELKGVVERAVFHASSERRSEIVRAHLPSRLVTGIESNPRGRLTESAVRDALAQASGNRTQAARMLGVHRNSLYRYLPVGAAPRSLSVDDPRA